MLISVITSLLPRQDDPNLSAVTTARDVRRCNTNAATGRLALALRRCFSIVANSPGCRASAGVSAILASNAQWQLLGIMISIRRKFDL